MTIDEAIQHCRKQVQEQAKKGCYSCAEEHQQLAEWMKELKAYKENTCGDAISRQAVLDALDNVKYSNEFCEEHHIDWSINLSMAHIVVNKLKPVTPQQRTGHWLIMDDCEHFIAKCSECGRIEDSRMINKYPYCHCGAKMQGCNDEYKPLQLWKCKRCEKLIPYEADYCHECADELFEHMAEIHKRQRDDERRKAKADKEKVYADDSKRI